MMNVDRCEETSWLISRHFADIYLEETEKHYENLSQETRYSG